MLHVTLKGAVNVQVSSNTVIFYLKLMPYFNLQQRTLIYLRLFKIMVCYNTVYDNVVKFYTIFFCT